MSSAIFINSDESKILSFGKEWTLLKLKAFAVDNYNLAKMVHFFFDMIENVRKGQNHDINQHFPPYCFQMASFQGHLKAVVCSKALTTIFSFSHSVF